MNTDITQSPPDRASEIKAEEQDREDGKRALVAQKAMDALQNNKYVSAGTKAFKTVKDLRTVGLVLAESPAIIAGIAIVAVVIVGAVIFALTQINAKDALSIGIQCQILGKPSDQSCLTEITSKTAEKFAEEDPDSTGSIANPTPTFPPE